MTDVDWNDFARFAEKNFVSSHPIDRHFNEFWYRRSNGSWTISLAKKEDNSIAAISMMIEVPGRICNIVTPFTWMSTALAEVDVRRSGVGGQLLFQSHRELPLIGCTCANENTLPINEVLGLDIFGLQMRRFVYIFTPKCLSIVKPTSRAIVLPLVKNPHQPSSLLNRTWIDHIPHDFNKLWTAFSKPFACVVERDCKYMTRRYVEAPYQDYHFLEVRDASQKIFGMTVIRFQKTIYGDCARIVDFIAYPGSEVDVWLHTLHACLEKNILYADFIVMGTAQDEPLNKAGFILATDQNSLEDVPNLLSPINYRRWSYTFHISGTLPRKLNDWRTPHQIWFTKGDGDRDLPTPLSISEYKNS